MVCRLALALAGAKPLFELMGYCYLIPQEQTFIQEKAFENVV